MRKTFSPLDNVLIERLFQPALDFITDQSGVSRATAACFCADAASFSWIVSRAMGLSDAVTAWDAGKASVDFAVLLLGLTALTGLRTVFRRAGKSQGNPLRTTMRPHRAIVLLMLVARLMQLQTFIAADLADLAMLLFAASALYLGACAQRPPVKRRSTAFAAVPAR
jgi:hypothetical protein